MTNAWPWWEKSKATAFPACNWRPTSVWNQNFSSAAHKHNLFPMHFKKNWTWACDYLKTSNLSADNFKKYSTSMGRYLSPRYSQVIMVSGYPVLTAVNWSQHGCAACATTRLHLGSQLARKCEIEHWFPCGAKGRAIGRSLYGHVITKINFLGWLDCLSYGTTPSHVELR